jgi:hypothetical protein
MDRNKLVDELIAARVARRAALVEVQDAKLVVGEKRQLWSRWNTEVEAIETELETGIPRHPLFEAEGETVAPAPPRAEGGQKPDEGASKPAEAAKPRGRGRRRAALSPREQGADRG